MLRRLISNQKGGVIVLFALALVVLCGFTGLAVDTGAFYLQHTRLQNAVDAAALAGATVLPSTTDAENAARDYLEKNLENNQNIYKAGQAIVTFSNSNTVVKVQYTDNFPTYFLKAVGISGADIQVVAAARKTPSSAGHAFDYTVFNGSKVAQLVMNGGSQYVDGSVHSNQGLILNGSNQTVTGALETVSTVASGLVKITGSGNSFGSRIEGSDVDVVDMPDYYDDVKATATSSSTTLYDHTTVTLNSQSNLNNNIYVNGNVTINGSNFDGTGAILAEGTISINGSDTSVTSNDQVCFFSNSPSASAITVNGSADVTGILYAPNGTIRINGSAVIHGRIIAKQILINSGAKVYGASTTVTSLPGGNNGLTQLIL
jgi:Flp pilus assembly protein TadG